MITIASILESEYTADDMPLLHTKFIRKLRSFAHAPVTRQHALRMLPFAASDELLQQVLAILSGYELTLLGDSKYSDFDVIGYYYCIALLVCCLVYEKGDADAIYAVLQQEIKKEQAVNRRIETYDETDPNHYQIIHRILHFFAKDTARLNGLKKECLQGD